MSPPKRHWFTLAIPVLAVTCHSYPDPMKSGGSCHVEKYKDKLICGMFFCSGLGLSLNAFQAAATRGVGTHLFIQGFSLIAIPCAFAVTAPAPVPV